MGDYLAAIDMGRKVGAVPVCRGWPFLGGGLVPHLTQCRLGLRTKWHLNPSSRLATIDIWAEKWGLYPLFLEGGEELGPHLTQCRLWCETYLHSKWHLDPSNRLATMDMGRKVGG